MKRKLFKLLFLLLPTLKPLIALSSTTADVGVDIFVHEMYQLGDLQVPYLVANESDVLTELDLDGTDNICIFSNNYVSGSTPKFQIGAVSENGTLGSPPNPGQFISTNGFDSIQYYVSYGVGPSASSFNDLIEGQPSENISLPFVPGSTCSGGAGNNMTIRIHIPGHLLSSVTSGVYSDTLTIDIFPPT